MKTKALLGIVLLAGLAFVAACTNKEGSSEAPVFITVSMDFQPGFIDVGTPAPVQGGHGDWFRARRPRRIHRGTPALARGTPSHLRGRGRRRHRNGRLQRVQ